MKRIVCGVMVVCLLFSYALAGTWTCAICNFENEAGNLFCGTCGASRSGWECGVCGMLNDEDAAYCKGCGLPKDRDMIWTCASCGTVNVGKFCGECGLGKDGLPAQIVPAITGREQKGDVVRFGNYGGEGIEWQVLENDGSSLFLLSVYGLEAKAYDEEAGETSWGDCTLRAWLNNDFRASAFNEDERGKLLPVAIHGLMEDEVSLLSVSEVTQYFNVDGYLNDYSEKLVCMPTQHAIDNGAWTMKEDNIQEWQDRYEYEIVEGACWWWLRYSSGSRTTAPTVGSCGDVSYNGGEVYHKSGSVRPFIRVAY